MTGFAPKPRASKLRPSVVRSGRHRLFEPTLCFERALRRRAAAGGGQHERRTETRREHRVRPAWRRP